jgi:glycosyltransferase involved in cell wall biosynthesis
METKSTQKLITFVIPAYNSAPFMHYAIDSLLPFGDRIEVLIIDDGSKDDTGKIADDYAKNYPFVRAIHQPNGGHGEGINHGLLEAKGIYLKVLDSDDWVDGKALEALLDDIEKNQAWADLYLTNYVYWQGREKRGQVISFAYLFRHHQYHSTWKKMRPFKYSSNITLHSAMYKCEVLRRCGVKCPQHVSYEDNYFVYAPLPYVKNVSYVPVDLYQYLIGREGQSMENTTCIRKYHDYMVDGKLIFDAADLIKIRKENHALFRAMYHHLILSFIMVPTFARLNGSPQAKADLKEFWAYCKKNNKRLYHLIRWHYAVIGLSFPGKGGEKAVRLDYKLAHKIVKFN